MSSAPGSSQPLVQSYLALRMAIGVIAIALPFVLALAWATVQGAGIEPSISAYYHTGMRDVFVGALCAIGVFLWSYRGYDRRDDRITNLAAVCAIGVAWFPTTPVVITSPRDTLVGGFHYAFAAVLFGTLAYISLVLFTKKAAQPTRRKEQRNQIYRTCGVVILACIAGIAVIALTPADSQVHTLSPVFWLEAAAIVAFGLSWLTKGEAILGDEAAAFAPTAS